LLDTTTDTIFAENDRHQHELLLAAGTLSEGDLEAISPRLYDLPDAASASSRAQPSCFGGVIVVARLAGRGPHAA